MYPIDHWLVIILNCKKDVVGVQYILINLSGNVIDAEIM